MRRILSIAITDSFLELALPETQFIVSNTDELDVTTVSQKQCECSETPGSTFHQSSLSALNLTEVNGGVDEFF